MAALKQPFLVGRDLPGIAFSVCKGIFSHGESLLTKFRSWPPRIEVTNLLTLIGRGAHREVRTNRRCLGDTDPARLRSVWARYRLFGVHLSIKKVDFACLECGDGPVRPFRVHARMTMVRRKNRASFIEQDSLRFKFLRISGVRIFTAGPVGRGQQARVIYHSMLEKSEGRSSLQADPAISTFVRSITSLGLRDCAAALERIE